MSAILAKIQNGGGAKVQNNKKLGLNIARVSAILLKFQNGSGDMLSRGFVYIRLA